MEENKMIFIGEKESFVLRILMGKMKDIGVKCEFVAEKIGEISKKINDVSLIVLFLDDGQIIENDILHFLTDVMEDKDLRMILIGEQKLIHYVCDHIPGNLVYRTFEKPVDNSQFTSAVTEFFLKAVKGAFRKRILVVDDDPQYLTMVRQWLKDTYNVSMANSGLQAIKWLGSNKADLILLDYEMPVTSGPQVLEMLRSDSETSSIPVMFLTGKGDKDSVMAVVSLKPEGYFLKNIQKDELLAKLQEFFILHIK